MKMDTRKIECDAADWIELAQERIRFLAFYFDCAELPDWLINDVGLYKTKTQGHFVTFSHQLELLII
jgi:hypothetical protein